MFDKLSNSWDLVQASGRVLARDKELLLFPVLSALAMILVTATFFVPGFFFFGKGGGALATPLGYVLMFAFYVAQYTVIFFFNSALVSAAMIRLDGGDPTLADGLRVAKSRILPILGYAAIAATVGLILKALAERSEWLGRLVIGLIGTAWNLATFLVVPVLVSRNVGPLSAIDESARILKKIWGEQIAGNLGIGLVFTVIAVPLALIGVPLGIWAAGLGQPLVAGAVIGLVVLAFALLALVATTLKGIYSAALYRFATRGDAGPEFDRKLIEGAFVKA